MASFFGFGSPNSGYGSSADADDPHLEVTVTPSASAFFAGELFSATIKFRNTRPKATCPLQLHPTSQGHPANDSDPYIRQGHVGRQFPARQLNAEAGPSRSPSSTPRSPSSPRASPKAERQLRSPPPGRSQSPTLRGSLDTGSPTSWQDENDDPDHHARVKPSSPYKGAGGLGRANGPPALPYRRDPAPSQIPRSHPHARQVSVSSSQIMSPPPSKSPGLPPNLPSIPERSSSAQVPLSSSMSRYSVQSSSSMGHYSDASPSVVDLTEYEEDEQQSVQSPASGRPPRSSRTTNPARALSFTSDHHRPSLSFSDLSDASAGRPPPMHPSARGRGPVEPRGTTTILWAYTHLTAHFHPSNTYIPPDPLLPLRAMLLHQPVGSGSLAPAAAGGQDAGLGGSPSSPGGLSPSPSRWQMSFGTGTIGGGTTPSFTGSLFGLAKDLVYGGQGGTLEEERKRVWNMKDLPVLQTGRSLIGVDVRLKEGEEAEYVYSMQLPEVLPPSHRGKAFRFSYDLVISLTVALPGPGRRQKAKDIHIPVRVWSKVTLSDPLPSYDVLRPVIQTGEGGQVEEAKASEKESLTAPNGRPEAPASRTSQPSLSDYAAALLGTSGSVAALSNGRPEPDDPSLPSVAASPSTANDPSKNTESSSFEGVDGERGTALSPRDGSSAPNGQTLGNVAHEQDDSKEAVEVLSRNVTKTSYDITKDGDVVAVFTLIKTIYRLGETVLGVVTFNGPDSSRQVLKLSAYLETHESIPENLLPISASSGGRASQPNLTRVLVEHHSSYAVQTSRLSFSLDIPSDGTPAFSLAAGPDGEHGGLEWKVKLAFLVASSRATANTDRKRRNSLRRGEDSGPSSKGSAGSGRNVMPVPTGGSKDPDNRYFRATEGISPVYPRNSRQPGRISSRSLARSSGDLPRHDSSDEEDEDDDASEDDNAHAPGRDVISPRARISREADRPAGMGIVPPAVWEEGVVEVIECEVPIRVLAGNTAFLVRPAVHTI